MSMDPILQALTAAEVAEALGAYVLRQNKIDPATVRTTTEVGYNTKGASIICAVRVSEQPLVEQPEPSGKQRGGKAGGEGPAS